MHVLYSKQVSRVRVLGSWHPSNLFFAEHWKNEVFGFELRLQYNYSMQSGLELIAFCINVQFLAFIYVTSHCLTLKLYQY